MRDKNIVLIGMPSSGKSTIGKCLSEMLGMDYIDTDFLIRQKENKDLKDIVNTDGLDRFLEIQEDMIVSLDMKGSIISTGGSVVYSSASMQHLKKHGIVVYLKLELNEIEERISAGRRFARTNGQSFRDLYIERTPLYEKYADIVLECSGKNVEEIAQKIIGYVKEL